MPKFRPVRARTSVLSPPTSDARQVRAATTRLRSVIVPGLANDVVHCRCVPRVWRRRAREQQRMPLTHVAPCSPAQDRAWTPAPAHSRAAQPWPERAVSADCPASLRWQLTAAAEG